VTNKQVEQIEKGVLFTDSFAFQSEGIKVSLSWKGVCGKVSRKIKTGNETSV